ncbi:MAG: PAS domain S-box protein [Chitinophagaceae bacterium]|nr:PAS domain S-box protein [Chitinophagaceae bacterium]
MRKLLSKISITHTLLALYIFLVASLLFIRIFESQKLKSANKDLQKLSQRSAQRQELLSEAQKSMFIARIHALELIYRHSSEEELELQKKVRNEYAKLSETFSKYEKLIFGKEKRALFDSLILAKQNLEKKGEEVFTYFNNNNIPAAREADSYINEILFPALQLAHYKLSLLSSQIDQEKEAELSEQITFTRQLSRLTATLIVLILIVLGIILLLNHLATIKNKARLRETENRYRIFVEEAHEFISRIDEKGRILFANKKVRERLGYSDKELEVLNLLDIIDEEYLDYIADLVTGQKKTPEQKIFCVLKSKNGEKVYIEGSLIWEFQNNKFAGATSFFNDVTEKILLQKSLRESENKFKQLFDLAPAAMFAFDPVTLRFVLVNASAILLYGYTREEFLQRTIMDIRPYEEIARTSEAIRRIVKENHIHNQVYKHVKKDGTMIDADVYASKIVLNDVTLIMSSITDITEKTQNEKRINQAILKTQEDERYELGSELHDNIGQLMAAAKMNLGLLKGALDSSGENAYKQTIECLTLATEEIRNLSHRLAPVFFQKGSLKDAILRLIDTFKIQDKYNFNFYFDPAFEAYQISQDLQLNLYRITQEGLRNILKYANANEIKLDLVLHKNNLRLLISDDGVGFDPEEITAGIGLSNMRRRAELFSGKMNLYSSPGEGSEIEIVIPMTSFGKRDEIAQNDEVQNTSL